MGRLRSCARVAGGLTLALGVSLACGEPRTPADEIHLPAAWHAADVDGALGGRFAPAANRALRRFQEQFARGGEGTLRPQYDAPGTVVFATSEGMPQTARRLQILLDHEGGDPETGVLILGDEPPDAIVARWRLDSGAWSGRARAFRVPGAYAANASFPFVRDYAPLIRVRGIGDDARADAVVAFRGPTLAKVLDAARGVASRRPAESLEARFEATEALAGLYAASLGVERLDLEILLDGGNLLGDGRGSCFATRVLLAQNGDDRARVEDELRRKLGCRRLLLMSAPQRLDRVQHVDTLLAFADPENAILSMPTLYESDFAAEYDNVQTLLEAGYKVHRVPRKTASITYTNFLVTRTNVYVPQYTRYAVEAPAGSGSAPRLEADPETISAVGGDALRRDNETALEVVARLFPGRTAVPVDSDETVQTLGSWHCLSHELPIAAPR